MSALPFEHQDHAYMDEPKEFGDLLQQLADSPKEMAIRVLLDVMRFKRRTSRQQRVVLDKCFEVIHDNLPAQKKICKNIFPIMTNGKEFDVEDVVGVALTILFSKSHRFDPTIHSCNMRALKYVKSKFPNSVLFRNKQNFTPIHGVAAVAASITFLEFFFNWHLEQNPWGCGGFYEVNDAGLTPVHILIDTQADITPSLNWLRRRGLINTDDVEGKQNLRKDGKNLIHFASQTSSLQTLDFLIQLFPSGVFEQDSDGNLPIHLHLGLRDRQGGTFSDQDFEITKLLIRHGMMNGGIGTIGGLFHKDPYSDEGEKCCTLSMLLEEVGDANTDRVWQMIDTCLNEVGDYANAPIVHAAIKHKHNIPDEVFQSILNHYGVLNRNDRERSPLMHAVSLGLKWDEGLSAILNRNREALDETDDEIGLPLLALAALKYGEDLTTLYELTKECRSVCRAVSEA